MGFRETSLAARSEERGARSEERGAKRDGSIHRLAYVMFPFYFSKPQIRIPKAVERARLICIQLKYSTL